MCLFGVDVCDRYISAGDLNNLLTSLKDSSEDHEVRQMLAEMNAGEEGITLQSYITYARNQAKMEYKDIFELIDRDCDGKITHGDLNVFLNKFGGTFALVTCMAENTDFKDIVDDMMTQSETDADGRLSLTGFTKAMNRAERASRNSFRRSMESRISDISSKARASRASRACLRAASRTPRM